MKMVNGLVKGQVEIVNRGATVHEKYHVRRHRVMIQRQLTIPVLGLRLVSASVNVGPRSTKTASSPFAISRTYTPVCAL